MWGTSRNGSPHFFFVHPKFGAILVGGHVLSDTKQTESPAITLHCPLVTLFDERSSRARTRRKSFSFFHHYLSLFLISDIFPLIVSEINGVIDE